MNYFLSRDELVLYLKYEIFSAILMYCIWTPLFSFLHELLRTAKRR